MPWFVERRRHPKENKFVPSPFDLSFFPAFLDLAQVTALDVATLYAIATVAVGGVMFGYAYVAYKAKNSTHVQRGGKYLRYSSGALLMGSGVIVASRG